MAALGTGGLNLNGGGIRTADATAHTLSNAVTFSANTTFGAVGTGDLTFSGGVNLGSLAETATVNGSKVIFSGVVSDPAAAGVSFTKAGTGTHSSSRTRTTASPMRLSSAVAR